MATMIHDFRYKTVSVLMSLLLWLLANSVYLILSWYFKFNSWIATNILNPSPFWIIFQHVNADALLTAFLWEPLICLVFGVLPFVWRAREREKQIEMVKTLYDENLRLQEGEVEDGSGSA